MHLIEILMAGSVFAIASSSSVQLWSTTALRVHQLATREQLDIQIEQDRLQLQTLWRSKSANTAVASGTGCSGTAEDLLAVAADHPQPPSLHRESQLTPNRQAVEVEWISNVDPKYQRIRLITPAGLGLCSLRPVEAIIGTEDNTESTINTPQTDSQVEGVAP